VWNIANDLKEFRVGKHNLAKNISNAQYNPIHIKVYFPYNDSQSVEGVSQIINIPSTATL
jgi:hypothetical protein